LRMALRAFRSPPGFVETTTPYPGFGVAPTPSLRSFRPFGPGSRTADPLPRVRRSADPFAPVSSALWAWESYRRPLTQGSSFRSPPGFGIPPTPSLRSHRPFGPGSRNADPLTRVRRSARHQGSAFRRPLRSGLIGPSGLGSTGFVHDHAPSLEGARGCLTVSSARRRVGSLTL
jgi:hypothetical protein